jgi:hypothetical protein
MITEGIRSMSPKDRIILMEELWESLCQDSMAPESPEWHKEALAERREMIESGKAGFFFIKRV